MRKRLLHLLRLTPLALLLASSAWAQTTGTIIGVVTDASTGKPVAGALIVARSPGLQGEQTAVTDEKGAYRLTQLPPGAYTLAVQLGGYRPAERSDITLRIDKTIRANLAVVPEAVQLQEQQVRTGTAPVINVGSAESGSVLTKEFLSTIPVGRTFEAAAVTAPTAQADPLGVGFAGAQSTENNYILDGMNVTDPRYGTSGATLLTNFVQEVDVKTGSFMPEYGRATGGIMNVVTKSGSNEFHGSVFGNWTPGQLTPSGNTLGRAGEAVAYQRKPGDGAYEADFGFDLGGPVIKDRLWFYGGFAPVLHREAYSRFLRQADLDTAGAPVRLSNGDYVQSEIPGTRKAYFVEDRGYQFNGKLTYLLDENNNFTLSGFGNPGSNNLPNATNNYGGFFANGADSVRTAQATTSSYDVLGHYAGKFMEKRLVVEAVGGFHRQTYTADPTTLDGVNQATTPYIRMRSQGSSRANVAYFESVPTGYCVDAAACQVDQYGTGGYGYMEDSTTNRVSGRLSASYLVGLLGSHNWKGGLDYERMKYTDVNQYSGLASYDYLPRTGVFNLRRGYGNVLDENATSLQTGVQMFPNLNPGAISTSTAFFLQDSWQVGNSGLTLNGGVRWEIQHMDPTDKTSGSPTLRINDNIAPRVQAIYDFTGTGRSKVAANWGRYFESIPLRMGLRAFNGEPSPRAQLNAGSCGVNGYAGGIPKAFDPIAAQCALEPNTIASATASPSAVAPNIQGMFVDQFGGSIEYELFQDFSVGFEYAGRRLGRVIEDMGADADGNVLFIGNPGTGKSYTSGGQLYDPRQVTGVVDPYTGRTMTLKFPKPERSYDGFTMKAAKNLSNNWLAQVSYTYSQLRGNYAGLFRAESNQLDPNITSEYDLPSLMANKSGLLPGDVTHNVKLYGAYVWNLNRSLNVTTGGAVSARSGTPVNALGAHPVYGNGEAFLIQRGMAGRTPFVTNVDLNGQVEYKLTGPYAIQFRMDVFNLFNSQEVLNVDQNYTFDTVQPIAGAQCKSKSAVSKKDPIAAIKADCPDLAYAKTTDGRPVTVNQNFGRAVTSIIAYQLPISFRFGLALTF